MDILINNHVNITILFLIFCLFTPFSIFCPLFIVIFVPVQYKKSIYEETEVSIYQRTILALLCFLVLRFSMFVWEFLCVRKCD